jgi:prefoldin subunit 5
VEAELSDEELEELEALLDELEEEESDFEEAEDDEETLASEFDELDDTLVPVSFVPVETFVFDEALLPLSPHEANKVMGSAINQMILLSI